MLRAQCPQVEAVMIDACGTEQSNEFLVINSGGGFNTSTIMLDFDVNNNIVSIQNNDINTNNGNVAPGTPCGLTTGNAAAVTGCSNVIAVGSGFDIPANAIVILQTSVGAAAGVTNFASLCGSGQCVYVISSSCTRTAGGFTNFGAGTRTTEFSAGGCSQIFVYNRALLANANGAYYLPVSDSYGSGGCFVPPSSPAPAPPTINQPPNVTVCAGDAINVPFAGTGSPTFTWTNTNIAIGLGASGSGDLNFTAANVATTQTGTITVTPTASNCPGLAKMFTITVNPLPTVTQPANVVLCGGAQVTANFTGTGSPTYSWTNDNPAIGLGASGTGNISFTSSNVASQEVATITVTPQNGMCPGVPKTFTITLNTNSLVDDPSDVAVCGGDPIGVIFSGSSPTFSWTNTNVAIGLGASGTGNLNFNAASVATTQTGTITVTPTGPCPGPAQMFTITVSPLPTVNQPANVAVCGGAMVTSNFTGTGGATFSWTNDNPAIGLGASGNGNISFSSAAVSSQEVATITVTPANGPCPGVPKTFTITINPNSLVDDPADLAVCGGDPISVAFTGSSPTFFWTNSNPAIGLGASGTGNLNFNAASVAATQTGTITVTPTGTCPGPAQTFTITVSPLPTVNQPANVVVCGGATVTSNFTGTGGATFSWTNDNPAIGLGASGNGNISFSSAAVTSQQVATITVTPANGPCPGVPKTFTITINPNSLVDDPANLAVCGGDPVSVTFTGSSPTFSWTNSNPAIGLGASGTGNLNFNAAAVVTAQTATITVTPTGTCPGPAQTFTIMVSPLPIVNQPANVVGCGGATINANFTGSGGATFSWTNDNPAIGLGASGNGNISFTSAAVSSQQVATITVTPANGPCPGVPKTFTITINPNSLVDDPSDLAVCGGDPVSVTFTGSSPTFSWTNSNPAIGLSASGFGDLNFNAALVATTQTGTITVTPTGPCPGPAQTFTIMVSPLPTVTQPANVVGCGGNPVNVNFTGTGSPAFTWTNSNPAIGLAASGTGNISFTSAVSGSQEVATITVTPDNGTCPGLPKTFTITINPPSVVDDPADVGVCGGDPISVNFTGTAPTFNWTNSNPAIGLGASGAGNLNFNAASVAITQTATITVTPTGPCPGPAQTFTITVSPQPTVTQPASVAVCGGNQVVVNFTGTGVPTFSWTNSNTAIGLAAAGTGSINFFSAAVVTQQVATITVTPQNGSCAGLPKTFTITINPASSVTAPADEVACGGMPVSVIFSGSSPTFSWTNSNTGIGLGASGTGNLNFNAATVATTQVGTITVTPTGACPGPAETFTITVNPPPTVLVPPNQVVCANATVAATFSGTGNPVFSWTNSNTAIGLGASGTGDLSFTAGNVATVQTGTITVTPSLNGCMGLPKTFTITVNPAPLVNQPANLILCSGAAMQASFAGSAGATFNWTNNNTAIGLPASGSGNINTISALVGVQEIATITVTPQAGTCPGLPKTFTITVNPAPTVDATADLSACGGQTISVPLTGTGAPTISWTNSNTAIGLGATGTGSINFVAANLMAAQTGIIIVTPSGGICPGIPDTFSISVVTAPTVTQPSNTSACSGGTVNIPFSGTAGAQFSWTNSNPAIGLPASGTGSLNFPAASVGVQQVATITITPELGTCTGTPASFTITVNPVPTASISGNQTICSGNSTTLTASGGGTYVWSTGAMTAAITVMPPSNTTYSVVTTNTAGCTASATAIVTVNNTSGTTLLKTSCNPMQVGTTTQTLLNQLGCDSTVTTITTLLPSSTTNLTGKTCNPANAGTFTQTLMNQFGCDSTITTVITFDPAAIDTTILAKTSCDPMQVGSVQNLLSGVDGCDSLVITNTTLLPSSTINLTGKTCNPANAGTFMQVLVNQFGCDSTVITVVTFDPAAVDTTILAKTSCDPMQVGSVQNLLTGVDGCDSLVITNTTLLPSNTTNLATKTCNPANAGTFMQVLTNQFGCDSTVTTVVTFDPAAVDTTILTKTSCDLTQVGSVQNLLSGVDGCDSLVIVITTLLPGSTTTVTATTCDPTQVGSVQNLLTGTNGCDSLVITNTVIDPTLCGTTAVISTTSVKCTNMTDGQASITVLAGQAPLTYKWQDGAGQTGTGQVNSLNLPVTITGLAAGLFSVTITPAVGNSTVLTANVTAPTAINLQASAIIAFNGFALSCTNSSDGSAQTTLSGGTAPYQFLWDNGETTASIDSLAAGSYQVTATDKNGCTAQATVIVTAPEPLAFNLQLAATHCGDVFATGAVFASGGAGGYSAAVDGNQVPGLGVPIPVGTHTVQITDDNGCTADTTLTVSLPLAPSLFLPADTIVQFGQTLTIEAETNLSVWNTLTWQPMAPDSSCVNCLLQTWTPLVSQRYSVTIVDTFGCAATTSIQVRVNREIHVFVPNIFSPNGDGVNDLLLIGFDGSVLELSEFRVFDRWGEMVYNWDEPVPADLWPGWDGRFSGSKAEVGVYVYYLKIRLIDGTTQLLTGDLTIISR